jgi:putative heme-binding domain-containing protein
MASASGTDGGPGRERSQLVLLYLASALQRVSVERRWPLAEALAIQAEPSAFPDHTLLIWYGLEPLVAGDRDHENSRSARLLGRSPNLMLCRFIARRLVEADADKGLAAVLPALTARRDPFPLFHRKVLEGVLDALRGRNRLAVPKEWRESFAVLAERGDPEVRAKTAALGLVFGDARAERELLSIVADRAASSGSRQFALQSLVERRTPALGPLLITLLDDPKLRGLAVRALAVYNDPATPGSILGRYSSFSAAEREDAVATLAARPAWAAALLLAIGEGTVSRRDLNTTVARQVLAFRDPKLASALERTWGTIRPTAQDKTRLVAKYKAILSSKDAPPADPGRGRLLFGRTCAQCHRLFDSGGDVGPDLTGSDRANPAYILENVLDPSASVGMDYTLTTIATRDGRLISGILREQTPSALVIQTASERVTLSRDEIEAVKGSNTSMMPEGQLETLTPQEIRDLFSYLASTKQIPPANGTP